MEGGIPPLPNVTSESTQRELIFTVYLRHSSYCNCIPPFVTFRNLAFCPYSVTDMIRMPFSVNTITSLNRINLLVSARQEMDFDVIKTNLRFQSVKGKYYSKVNINTDLMRHRTSQSTQVRFCYKKICFKIRYMFRPKKSPAVQNYAIYKRKGNENMLS